MTRTEIAAMRPTSGGTDIGREPTREGGSATSSVARIGVMLLAATAGVALPSAVAGCGTARNAGEDPESPGETISDEAEDAGGG